MTMTYPNSPFVLNFILSEPGHGVIKLRILTSNLNQDRDHIIAMIDGAIVPCVQWVERSGYVIISYGNLDVSIVHCLTLQIISNGPIIQGKEPTLGWDSIEFIQHGLHDLSPSLTSFPPLTVTNRPKTAEIPHFDSGNHL